MALDFDRELALLRRLSVSQLQAKYAEVFEEQPRGRHRIWLLRRIAWRQQAVVQGGLSERARRRALELANEADLRLTPPVALRGATFQIPSPTTSPDKHPDNRLPIPGTLVTRRYKNRELVVKVLDNGFEFEGQIFTSLSAVAKQVTGSHWNGFHFFGLKKPGSDR